MIEPLLLDTDILLEVIRNRNPIVISNADAYLSEHDQYTLSSLTVLELVRGTQRMGRLSELADLLQVFTNAEILPLDYSAAKLAGHIHGDLERSGFPIGRIDPMIAAVAIEHSLPLCTGNHRHYKRIIDVGYPLNLFDWREPDAAMFSGES